MGILRLRRTDRALMQLSTMCSNCKVGFTYIVPVLKFEAPRKNTLTESDKEFNHYYEDIESGEAFCVGCIDSGKTMSNPNSKVSGHDFT